MRNREWGLTFRPLAFWCFPLPSSLFFGKVAQWGAIVLM